MRKSVACALPIVWTTTCLLTFAGCSTNKQNGDAGTLDDASTLGDADSDASNQPVLPIAPENWERRWLLSESNDSEPELVAYLLTSNSESRFALGTGVLRLYDDPNDAWSLEGNFAAFQSEATMHVFDFRGDEPIDTNIAIETFGTADAKFAWSPAEQRIAVVGPGDDPLHRSIVIENVLATAQVTIPVNYPGGHSETLPIEVDDLAWSPDGRWIAYTAGRGSTPPTFVADLSENPPTVTQIVDEGRQHRFSPDSTWLAVADTERVVLRHLATKKNHNVTVANTATYEASDLQWPLDGTWFCFIASSKIHATRVTQSAMETKLLSDANETASRLSLSSDGTFVSFSETSEGTNTHLAIVRFLETETENVGPLSFEGITTFAETIIVWAPFGTRAIALVEEGTERKIYLYQPGDSSIKIESDEPGASITWSADGRSISFVTASGTKAEAAIDLDSGSPTIRDLSVDGKVLTYDIPRFQSATTEEATVILRATTGANRFHRLTVFEDASKARIVREIDSADTTGSSRWTLSPLRAR